MKNSIAYDITHLLHRISYSAPSGIEKVDLAYGDYFAGSPNTLCAAAHYGIAAPILFRPQRVQEVVKRVSERWHEDLSAERDQKFQSIRRWILSGSKQPLREAKEETLRKSISSNGTSLLRTISLSILRNGQRQIPEGAIYLNVAQHALEFEIFFRWLSRRPDLQKVFFIHDLLPLDHPEFWPNGYEERFRKRIDCATKYGTAFLTASTYVRDRLQAELAARGRPKVPIFAQHLPTTLRQDDSCARDPELANNPYFLIIGTIEPRKNHLLLLNIWRELVSNKGQVPKLVLVGKRGWMNDYVVNLLDHAKDLRDHVAEVSGLASDSLRLLVANARAVLFPTLVEGFGLPIVEALACGTPVLASDIPVLREVSKNHALFRHPLDGFGWLDAVRQLADINSPLAKEARATAAAFDPVSDAQYFSEVCTFLDSLS